MNIEEALAKINLWLLETDENLHLYCDSITGQAQVTQAHGDEFFSNPMLNLKDAIIDFAQRLP